MNFEAVKGLIASLGTMKYFPSDPAARLALVELCGDLTDDENQVRWLVKRLKTLYAEWPGEREMRACFCSRFKPKDGMEVGSTVYQDGIPSERKRPDEPLPALPAGCKVSADRMIESGVRRIAQARQLR